MSDTSFLMSDGLIDKVDMSKFYNLLPEQTQFECELKFNDAIFKLSVSSFKRTNNYKEIQFLCNADIVELLISNQDIKEIQISRNNKQIFSIKDPNSDKIEIEINYIQDISSQVKIMLNN